MLLNCVGLIGACVFDRELESYHMVIKFYFIT